MKLQVQKRLAASILKRSKSKVAIDTSRLEEVKEAITRFDVKGLIKSGAITAKAVKGPSKVRARKIQEQKRKGRRKGAGSKKGKATARLSKKEAWMIKVRAQRGFLKELKEKEYLDAKTYRDLYRKSAGGFFRSRRHIKLYIEEHNLVVKK